MRNKPRELAMKLVYTGSKSKVVKANILILEPKLNVQTLSYAEVVPLVEEFYRNHIANSNRTFAFISGDQQVWIKLWKLRKNHPQKYGWLIPLPGEWHWMWHIIKGIFRVYSDLILRPVAILQGYSTFDAEANNFHYAEDILQMVTIAVCEWVKKSLPRGENRSITQWLHSLKVNPNAYELVYACIYYFIPYWVTRSALKWNKHEHMKELWRYWLHLFIATGKTNYAALTIQFLWILTSLHPDVLDVYYQHRVISFSGDPGTGIAIDGVNELVSTLDSLCIMFK
jgi:hypothetical protein